MARDPESRVRERRSRRGSSPVSPPTQSRHRIFQRPAPARGRVTNCVLQSEPYETRSSPSRRRSQGGLDRRGSSARRAERVVSWGRLSRPRQRAATIRTPAIGTWASSGRGQSWSPVCGCAPFRWRLPCAADSLVATTTCHASPVEPGMPGAPAGRLEERSCLRSDVGSPVPRASTARLRAH